MDVQSNGVHGSRKEHQGMSIVVQARVKAYRTDSRIPVSNRSMPKEAARAS